MKRFLTILSLVILGFASTSCYDDSALWESVNELDQRVKTLETLCTEMNTNLTSLQTLVNAMKQGDYIVDVAPLTEGDVEVGYKITFNERGTINIYHGKDGASSGDVPEFGVKQDTDGVYYWTVNGEWLLDAEGNKLPVTPKDGAQGVTPKLKVENEKWYVSYDEGKTWEEVGSAVTAGTGSCIFKDVKLTEDALTLTMADGSVIVVPIGEKFRIVLGEFDAESIQYGKEVVVPYTIEGAKGEVSVFVLSDGWMFETELKEETALSGKVTIWQDDYYDEEIAGKVAIFAVAEDGTAVSKVIRLLSGVLYPSSDNYNDTYTVSAEAGQLEFTVSTNREVEVSTGADWITYADTKAVEEKTLVFDIQENDGARRKTYVEIASGDIDFGFTVTQKGFSDGFSLEYSCDEVLGGWWQVSVDTLYNKTGQKIHEVLGYSSWEEVAAAAGDYDALINRTGEVKLLSYDLYTGEALPYDEQYRNGLGFMHDEEGYLVDNWSYNKSGWMWYTLLDGSSEYLNNEFRVYTANIYAGESLSFGILLTSPTGEARIEVTINVTEYVDPEAGLYDNPASPGTYEFVISDTLDVDNQLKYPSSQNLEIAEQIKSTLGMTTYEIYQAIEWGGFDREYVFADGRAEYGNRTVSLDKYGNDAYWLYDSMIAGINWLFGATYMYMEHWFQYEGYDNGRYIFTPAVYDAVGSTAKYDYIIRYNGYKLIFTHEISIVGEKPSKNWYLVGDFNDWITGDAAYQMVDEGDWYVYYGFTTTGNMLKFDAGDWSDNRGGDFLAQNVAVTLWQDGAIILVPEGKYDIYLNKEATEAYFMAPGLKPGEKPSEPVEPGVIWENDGTVGAAYWGNTYRFSIEGGDANNECCAEIPADIWADMKVAPFSVEVQPAADWWQIRILSGWWSNQWPKEGTGNEYDIFATTEGVVANEDGTYTFEVDLRGHSLADAMDQEHILFTGDGFIINKIYFATGEEEFVQDYRWTKNPTADLWEGYDASQKVKLAKYGDYVLVANGKKIGAINPKTGVVENVYDSPIEINSFCTDDAGNILIANDGVFGEDINVYVLSDINGTPELLATYNTGNYYALETGNLRVKGNVKGDAVITLSASDGAGGAVIYWEITGGECSPWYWTSVPYSAWSVTNLCCAPAGSTLSDGFFYIGYGGDFNLKYAGNVVKDGTTDWVTSYVTGSTWMENYNCISTAKWNGTKYAATVMGCHFEYDSADALLLNVNNPAAAELVYTHHGDGDVAWDWAAGVNPSWTGLGAYSDVLLVPTEDALLMVYVDSNYGAMACVAIQ